ncbi:MAG: CPXCG motif-containing cysteine-rich protein [Winogradskyella sp.]|uniref:CPXCG motif-containing cysteine-rich protein n=1 Tax=Winogradskyella sp. TaxID=1883156 RepID=UPI00182D8C8B|nr:CPXCG motif-containing cysteine-rich protein [Winogradskyella sp.]MBT8244015.1 CPXCG motif-containing cysteine-rich protein [Winogradskyella sp.]NNK23314.1 CPXCG motif-containing cysteine-rich protein [Winogradskyella sp.]
MEEYFFQCPHCWEEISMLIDVSETQQTYIEDCEVCCNPIQINAVTDGTSVSYLDASSIEQ